MSDAPGYPLPDGELGSDDLVCQLVYLPDRPEYWQAFLGALHYMTTWRAWERDADKRGKDAAANWRAAFELTIGCWRMTCLEQLQDDVAAILAIMEMPQSCCDEQDVTGGDRYTDRVTDGVGDVPQNIIDAGYADDAADWDGFDDYKCMIVHVTVNQMEARLYELAPLVEVGGAIFGGLSAIAAIITVIFSGGSLAIVFGIFASVGVVATLYDSLFEGSLLELLAVKVDANQEELACAMYWADGDESALVALNDKIDELFTIPEALILKNLNNGPTLKALYSGRYDQQDIAAELEAAGYDLEDFDCTCDVPIGEYQHVFDFNSSMGGWQVSGVTRNTSGGRDDSGCAQCLYHTPFMYMTHNNLRFQLDGETGGAGDSLVIHSVRFWHKDYTSTEIKPRLTIEHSLGTSVTDFPNSGAVWLFAVKVFSPALIIEYDDLDPQAIRFESHFGSVGFQLWDDWEIDVDVVDV